MKSEGWTLRELEGELWARGIDIRDVRPQQIERVMNHPRPETAAREIEKEMSR